MAEIDNVLAELRHRIMRSFESEPPKPARPQHQETNEEGLATTQSVDAEYQRHGSAAVALRRLAHPGRDGVVVVEDDPVSEPINPEQDGGVVVEEDPVSEPFNVENDPVSEPFNVENDPVSEPIDPERGDGVAMGDDPISPLIRRLSLDMPKLMEEVVAFIERRIAELNRNDGGAPKPIGSVAPLPASATPQDDDTGKVSTILLFDTRVLARIDADAKRLGISRTAWLHVAAGDRLEGRR